jgi:eukaryotic-like serine/threonine-protein kinase
LLQLAAGGGVASPVVATEPGRPASHQAPTLLPDGRHFVYLRAGAEENKGIYLGSLDAKLEAQGSKRLLAEVSEPAYAPGAAAGNGYLLFVREGTLLAQPFDPVRLELSGDAVPVAEQVAAGSGHHSRLRLWCSRVLGRI